MAKTKAIKVYETYLVVEGMGEFPLDMCRYDCCFPSTEQDAGAAQHHEREKRKVMLIRRSLFSGGPEDRWASFGWKVLYTGNDKVDATMLCRQKDLPL